MLAALIVLSIIALIELGVIIQLLNRLLISAKVEPLSLPKLTKDDEPTIPTEVRRKVMSIPMR